MLTGEGKSLTGSLAAVVLSLDARDLQGRPLPGRGVQWMTPNQKLVREAVLELRPIARRLGISFGEVLPQRSVAGKRAAYDADISIGPVGEYLFDELRSRRGTGQPVHGNRGGFTLLDEVDQMLLDEALTPHVLATDARGRAPLADLAWSARVASVLEPGLHFTPTRFGMELTAAGLERIEAMRAGNGDPVNGRDLGSWRNRPLVGRVQNALMHQRLVREGYQFIRQGDEIVIVDKAGERLEGRRWDGGLHEAIEFAVGGPGMVGRPTRMFGSITLAEHLAGRRFAGMTGTAGGALDRAVFRETYGKDVVEIAPRSDRRRDHTVTYLTADQKWDGVFQDVVDTIRNQPDRPVLVMTGSVFEAEAFSQRLADAGVRHNLITARTAVADEINFIRRAGQRGQVTVATNRLGRGVDIKLGGDVEFLANRLVQRRHPGLAGRDRAAYRQALVEARTEARTLVDQERAALNDAGGLHVVLTEFPESQRIEMQARGRAARQDDEGTSTLHRSLEDPLLQPPGRGEYAAPGRARRPRTSCWTARRWTRSSRPRAGRPSCSPAGTGAPAGRWPRPSTGRGRPGSGPAAARPGPCWATGPRPAWRCRPTRRASTWRSSPPPAAGSGSRASTTGPTRSCRPWRRAASSTPRGPRGPSARPAPSRRSSPPGPTSPTATPRPTSRPRPRGCRRWPPASRRSSAASSCARRSAWTARRSPRPSPWRRRSSPGAARAPRRPRPSPTPPSGCASPA
ncbi:hypothetical protein BJF78_34820 [Pseudonocardia sp. CNS-139]|nr:hypothetical protein BJF78_34820 [Pseudonocardia sp. CNS-139]